MSNIIAVPESGLFEINHDPARQGGGNSATASVRLDGDGNNSFITGSNFGIGTNNPTNDLHVKGTMQLDNSVSDAFKIRINGGVGLALDHNSIKSTNAGTDITLSAGKDLIFQTYDGGFNDAVIIDTAGDVGIGTTDPQFTLDVDGSIHGTSGNFSTAITVGGNPVMTGVSPESDTLQTVTARGATSNQAISVSNIVTSNEFVVGNQGKVNSSSTVGLQLQSTSTNKPIKFLTNVAGQTERMRIEGDGKVGIGISDPDTELEVGGTIKASTHADAIVIGSPTTVKWKMGVYGANDLLIRDPSDNTKFSILSGGNVGIGTTGPSQLLHLFSSTTNPIGIGLQNSQRYYSVRSNNFSLVFTDETVGSERMRIDSSGDLGIGVTNPQARLDVNSSTQNKVATFTSTDTTAFIQIADSNTTATTHGYGANGNVLSLYANEEERVRIHSDGNVSIGTNTASAILTVLSV